ncbi:hypothetical protein MF271_24260 (plasmid) [Deinococcus sp. KNUC1210]|uniref:hypothetical protein n=1 Tax=Deinococcus sp. KNUC1210 TaxID=2917691 RepID=UPI001EEF9317|nr:hypothetical protein [Deinococcus sp. KNUC1210]ULH18075.1 hypothetical protein MF271_24260 [Deinococcus sp. KNUC1210]
MLVPIHDPALEELRAELAQYPRMDGYYQLDLVSIKILRQARMTQNEILKALYDRWAPHEANAAYRAAFPFPLIGTPTLEQRTPEFNDYESTVENALEALTYELKGGSGIGHLADTISPVKAAELATRFFALFRSPQAYRGLGLADPFFVFEQGVVLLDDERAACLLMIESD